MATSSLVRNIESEGGGKKKGKEREKEKEKEEKKKRKRKGEARVVEGEWWGKEREERGVQIPTYSKPVGQNFTNPCWLGKFLADRLTSTSLRHL